MHRLLAILLLAATAACGIPQPTSTKAQFNALKSITYKVGPPLGTTVFGRIAGDPNGRRVIFVHGTPGGVNGWRDYLLNVPDGYQFIAIDRPGFGDSGPRGAVVSLRQQAQALEPLLKKQGGGWPILVGHSLGGPIIARAAADYPGRVGGLVILAGSMDPALEKVQLIQQLGEAFGLVYLIPRRMRNANRELIGLKKELIELRPMLKTIRCPVIIVHGTKDTLVPYSNVAYMQKHLSGSPRVEVVKLEGQNHFLPWLEKTVIDKAVARVGGGGMPLCAAARQAAPGQRAFTRTLLVGERRFA